MQSLALVCFLLALIESSLAFTTERRRTVRGILGINKDQETPYSRVSGVVLSLTEQTNDADIFQDSAELNGSSSGSGGLVTASDAKTQLFSAFTALQLPDQYDAVLTGLCAKILDSKNARASTEETVAALQDPLQLLQEMNDKRIMASPRSLMALIDSTVKSQDAQAMAQVLSLCTKNGGIQTYGSLQADILPLPPQPTSRVKCPDGSTKTRTDRLTSVTDIPTDNRGQEVTNALAVSAVAAGCTFTDIAHMNDITLYTNALLTLMVGVGVVDNFYDLIKTGSNMAARQVGANKDAKGGNSGKPPMQLPDKESLPLGLGSGLVSGSVVRGLTRLLTVDAERECDCEAAGLFAAYSLGLPCFAFRPNALEASVLVVESTTEDSLSDSLLSATGIMRVLVWLMAPVAMESMKHPQLIISDPREAEGFLLRLEDFSAKNPDIKQDLWWTDDEQERSDLLKWAYTEADLLLRDNRKAVTEIAKRLTGGAATVGDCVATMERW